MNVSVLLCGFIAYQVVYLMLNMTMPCVVRGRKIDVCVGLVCFYAWMRLCSFVLVYLILSITVSCILGKKISAHVFVIMFLCVDVCVLFLYTLKLHSMDERIVMPCTMMDGHYAFYKYKFTLLSLDFIQIFKIPNSSYLIHKCKLDKIQSLFLIFIGHFQCVILLCIAMLPTYLIVTSASSWSKS